MGIREKREKGGRVPFIVNRDYRGRAALSEKDDKFSFGCAVFMSYEITN